MFKDTQVTHLDPWSVTESSDHLPAIGSPLFVGSGKIGVGLDAAGLQSLPDRQGEHYQCNVKGFHVCQLDLYVLREGMISNHLWLDEIEHCDVVDKNIPVTNHERRNLMPLGWLDYQLAFGGETYEGDAIRQVARRWRRHGSLAEGIVHTRYGISLGGEPIGHMEIEAFTPLDGETLYLRLKRTAFKKTEGDVDWSVRLNLSTRHGLPLFDQPGSVQIRDGVIRAHIDDSSRYAPSEPYTVLYGVACEGARIQCDDTGWQVALQGPAGEAHEAWVRCDFVRLAGEELAKADDRETELTAKLAAFDSRNFATARKQHGASWQTFWDRTADIEVVPEDEYTRARRYVLHLSEYFLRCGNDHGLGGNATFLLIHQNGWKGCNFHDNHYLGDALLRSNQTDAALANLHWMRRVMHPEGRPFPWMMTYDGFAPLPPGEDRAPMSDSNRALLAVRIYEWAGNADRDLLADTVYPIVRAVADHALADWFYEDSADGELHFHSVENDVMNEAAHEDESGTVLTYLSVLDKAIAYAAELGIDADRQAVWQDVLTRYRLPQANDDYLAWRDAAPTEESSTWFQGAPYIAECMARLKMDAMRRKVDRDTGHAWSINQGWDCMRHACAEQRLERPDRAEQFIAHAMEESLYGPGYFEECNPMGRYGLAPFTSAHGTYVTATCEQVVRPDLWQPRIYIGMGLPRRWGGSEVRFRNLRATGGVIVGGRVDPESVHIELRNPASAWSGTLVVRLPSAIGRAREVTIDGVVSGHRFRGDYIEVDVTYPADTVYTVTIAKGIPGDGCEEEYMNDE